MNYLIANDVNASPETLAQLGKSDDQEIVKAVVRNPNTPTEILIELGSQFPEELGKNPILDSWLLANIHPLLSYRNFNKKFALNPNTPVSLLKALVKDSDWIVRNAVAENPNTPVSLLEILVKDSYDWVRIAVAENPNTPVSLLEALVKDSDWIVRCTVAKNPNTPITALEILAKDSHYNVRCAVAENPNMA